MWLHLLLQGFPLRSPNHFMVSRVPTSSPTALPFCLSPTMDTSLLRSAAARTPARQWRPAQVCWRAVHCGIWATVPDRWDSEQTCPRDPRGTNPAPVTQVDTLIICYINSTFYYSSAVYQRLWQDRTLTVIMYREFIRVSNKKPL